MSAEVACWNSECKNFDRAKQYAGMGECKLNVVIINGDGECAEVNEPNEN